MIVSICASVFDPVGAATFNVNADSDLGRSTRRVSRVKTLDGLAVLSDNGHSESDRTITLKFKADHPLYNQLNTMLIVHPLMTLSTIDGCFEGVIEELYREPSTGNSQLKFLTRQRLDNA